MTNIPASQARITIYRIRGRYVMLDSDLAEVYDTTTKILNQAIKRNLIRFPPDFMFRLSERETQNLRSQLVTSSWGGRRYLPLAFTEKGIAMLSSVLRNTKAALVNIAIMRSFVKHRHEGQAQLGVARRVDKLEGKVDVHDTDIRLLIKDVQELKRSHPRGPILPDIV